MNSVEALILQNSNPTARRWTPENFVVIAFSVAVILILVLAVVGARALTRSTLTVRWVEHTHAVLHKVEQVRASLSDIRTDVQAYVITGDEKYLTRREQAVSIVLSSTRDLQEFTTDNPRQQARLAELGRAIRETVDQMTMLVVLRQTDGFNAAQAIFASGSMEEHTNKVDQVQKAVISEETDLLDQRTRDELDSRHSLIFVAGALIALVIATVFFGFARLRAELIARQRLALSCATQQKFLEAVLEHLPALVCVKDPKSLEIVTMNRAMERWFGRPREQLIGRATAEFFSSDDARSSLQTDREALAQLDVVVNPVDIRTAPNGTRVTMYTRKIAVRDVGGQPLFILSISDDISAKVADEQRIRELNATLEQQKADLQAANRELESFSYSVSHDLRSPLRAIDGFSLMLLEDYGVQLDAEAHRYLTTIRTGTQRMGQLIDDLLAFSRIGRQPLKDMPVDMEKLAQDAAAFAVREGSGTAPRIVVSSLPAARGDPSLLQQVWQNLIGNAVKYSSKVSTPLVEVAARQEGDEVVYSVRDNGAGFDMQFAHKLFGVFQRLHGQDEFPGTGVGLAIVHRIITRHSGRIWAESVPGHGATFQFAVRRAITA
jgi:PAS domain S-box-containing protein